LFEDRVHSGAEVKEEFPAGMSGEGETSCLQDEFSLFVRDDVVDEPLHHSRKDKHQERPADSQDQLEQSDAPVTQGKRQEAAGR
jgi:hypothetical protein